MKKIIFLLASAALIFSSCGDNAVKVNETIILQLESVNKEMQAVSDFISADQYDQVKPGLDSLNAKVLSAQQVIEQLKNKKAGVYKQSALDYLTFIKNNATDPILKATEMFKAAKEREQADIDSRKQDPNHLNFGPDFDAARKIIKDFRTELKKYQAVLLEKQEKFVKANGLE